MQCLFPTAMLLYCVKQTVYLPMSCVGLGELPERLESWRGALYCKKNIEHLAFQCWYPVVKVLAADNEDWDKV